jgi:hypothetical protein
MIRLFYKGSEMISMELQERRNWSEKHKELNKIILKPQEHSQAIDLFMSLHSMLHTSSVGNGNELTLEDEVLKDLDEKTFRTYPVNTQNTKNSIAWHLWHIARIEDMTMNILVSDEEQVFLSANWLEKMNVRFSHSGNDMSKKDIAELSSLVYFDALIEYRATVGKRTRHIVSSLKQGQFKEKVVQSRVKRLLDENAVAIESKWLSEYWSKKTIAGLILMPATRHPFMHLNKCVQIKNKYKGTGLLR